ncbi:ATP-binding protein [Trichodesmium erythraeum 21-75]|nr:ATP-binding protein [Trichodesmium erythraeum 21-75]
MQTNNHLSINPYVFGKPIYEYNNLFGRKNDVDKIKNHIINKDIKITLLHVQRRIGKTSLITCLPQSFTEEQNGVKFVTFSFQGYKDKPIPEILNYLADDIAGTIQLPQKVRDMANGTRNFFELFLPKVIDQYLSGQKLVLLLDEFDVLEEKDKKGKQLFDNLKKAVKEQKKLFAILVFGRPLKDMKYLETFLQEEGQETIEVGLLNYEGTKDLIVKPLERIQSVFRYEPSAIHRIWELSAGHPSLTQLLCSNVFVHCRNKQQSVVRKDDVDSILSQAMGEGEAILQGFIEPLSDIEKLFFLQ